MKWQLLIIDYAGQEFMLEFSKYSDAVEAADLLHGTSSTIRRIELSDGNVTLVYWGETFVGVG